MSALLTVTLQSHYSHFTWASWGLNPKVTLNPLVTDGFPSQRGSNTQSVSRSWVHHRKALCYYCAILSKAVNIMRLQLWGLHSLISQMSFHQISHNLETARLKFRVLRPLKYHWRLGSAAAEAPVRFRGGSIILTPDLTASRLHEIWW